MSRVRSRRGRDAPRRQPQPNAVSDREDFFGHTPTIDEDFHAPCPKCGIELVIRADQPIRRVRCAKCNTEYALDQRIGGELCLLPHNTREHADHRAWVSRIKEMRLRIVIFVVAAAAIGTSLLAITYLPIMLVVGVVILAVNLIIRTEKTVLDRRRARHARRRPR